MSTELQVIERSPSNDVAFGKTAAKALMDVVREQGLARKFGGQKEHIYVEAWQLLGQFAGLSARVEHVESVEVDGVKGAKATVYLIDADGQKVSGAVAYCMRDEQNWKNKPWFQLASMAQTRAVSKAFRNRLSWIAVLAGYSGTPAEEMESVDYTPAPPPKKPDSIEDRREKAKEWLKSKGKGIADAQDFLKKSFNEWDTKDLEALKDWGKAGFPIDEDIPL